MNTTFFLLQPNFPAAIERKLVVIIPFTYFAIDF